MSSAQFQGQEGNRAVFMLPSQERIQLHASLLSELPKPGTHGELRVHFHEIAVTDTEEVKQKNQLNALIYGSATMQE